MGQSLAQVYIHLIFSTKDRQRFLQCPAVNAELRAYMGGTLRELDCPSLAIGTPEDHVHVLFRLAKTRAMSDAIAKLKAASSAWVKQRGREYEFFSWQSGYGAFSVSASGIQEVLAYIANQGEHHKRLSYQDEFRAFLKKYEVEFDERYLWD